MHLNRHRKRFRSAVVGSATQEIMLWTKCRDYNNTERRRQNTRQSCHRYTCIVCAHACSTIQTRHVHATPMHCRHCLESLENFAATIVSFSSFQVDYVQSTCATVAGRVETPGTMDKEMENKFRLNKGHLLIFRCVPAANIKQICSIPFVVLVVFCCCCCCFFVCSCCGCYPFILNHSW